MSDSSEAVLHGFVDPTLASELPDLRLRYRVVAARAGRSPRAVKQRLANLSDRFGGRQALVFRNRPLPFAYRVLFRHIGLDPDQRLTPLEAIVHERLLRGGFVSGGLPADALTIAMVETSVALVAFDAAATLGRLGIRISHEGEELAGRALPLEQGTLVIADERRPLAELFGEPAKGAEVGRRTEQMILAAIAVAGVSEPSVEEALWLAAEVLEG